MLPSNESENISSLEVPERLMRNGRPVDNEFKPDEKLYVRCRKADVDEGRLIGGPSIRFPDWSVNRQKYSEAKDVLIPSWHRWGVAEFAAGDVPGKLKSDGGPEYAFRIEHDPCEQNYAHSEVRAIKGNEYDDELDVPKNVKKRFRQILSERTKVCHEPLE